MITFFQACCRGAKGFSNSQTFIIIALLFFVLELYECEDFKTYIYYSKHARMLCEKSYLQCSISVILLCIDAEYQ